MASSTTPTKNRRSKPKPRNCPGCGKPLSKERLAQRKKFCFLCEVRVKREQREAAHDRRVEALYGLKPGEYRKLLAVQNGRCAIAKCPARGVKKALAVDHDHRLGLCNRRAVRGALCGTHNRWIGMAGDDPEVFESLAEYLRNPPARTVLETG